MADRRYALFSGIPFAGHLNPLVRQAAELARRGWRVDVASTEEARRHVEGRAEGVDFLSLGSPPSVEQIFQGVADAANERNFFVGAVQSMRWINRFWPVMYDGLVAARQRRTPDVMVVDFITFGGLDAAVGLPTVVNNPDLLPMLPNATLPPAHDLPIPFSGRSIHRIRWWHRAVSPAIHFSGELAVAQTWIKDLNTYRSLRGLVATNHAGLLRGRPVLINSAFGLEYNRSLPPLLHMVGPMLSDEVEELSSEYREWFNEGPPVVYVNLGTVARPGRRQLTRMLEAFRGAEFRVLWILRERAKFPPQATPMNVRLEKWGPPLPSILSHPNVKAFVSHCGINSVHESMQAGTPIVGIPMLADQKDMGMRVQDAGGGLVVDKLRFSSRELRDCILRVMREERFRDSIVSIQATFKLAGGARRAADLIECAAEKAARDTPLQ